MAPQVSPLGIGFPATIALISFALLLYLFYRWLLPKPIPGIPYNKASAKSLLGDIPAFLNAEKQTQEIFPWMRDQFHVHKSPIVQVFCQPFGKPWVLVGDFVEAEDILIRRNHEFSRSPQLASYFSGTTPNHHIVMPSNDEFKQHRQLIQDMITPNFLHQITAPQIYERFSSLMDFWKEKSRLAQGHAFSIKQDIYNAGMDTVWTAAFGFESAVNATKAQVELLASLPSVEVSSDAGTPVVFPVAPYPREYTAITELIDTIEIALKSPLPKFAHWCVRQTGKYRRNYKIKEDLIKSEIEKRAVVLNGTEKKDFSVRCGLDDMLRRELISAERHGRRPDFHTRTMYDEVCFDLAAHDSI